MKVLLNPIILPNKLSTDKKAVETQKVVSFCGIEKTANYSSLKPLTKAEKERLSELKKIEEATTVNGNFSTDKAAELLKSKIDEQQMLYSEDDIKSVVAKVTKKNPSVSKQKILNVLMKLSSFSNYESLKSLEAFCIKNKISEVYKTKELTLNSILSYFSKSSKKLLDLPTRLYGNNPNKVIIIDRETINELKKQKEENSNTYIELKTNIENGSTKLVILDGFEAKTKDGIKSFNFAGGWGDLAEAASSIIKEERNGKNSFTDDIVKGAKDLFGKNVKINIINNDCDNIDEKIIAERLNPKRISEEHIKKWLMGVSKYSAHILKTTYGHPTNTNVLVSETQKALIKAFYPIVEVYSPRRIATELKELHKKINKGLSKLGKNFEDAIFIVPDKHKSFGLISYQYKKVNNTNNIFLYPNYKNTYLDRNLTRGKVFVFLDDFSGSGQSFINNELPYEWFKKTYPANSIIFAPVAYLNKSFNKINTSSKYIRNEIRSEYLDLYIGNNEIKDTSQYLKLMPVLQASGFLYAKSSGYDAGKEAIAFPHVIPDNCPDIAGYLLRNLLKSETANKTTIDFQKEYRIESLSMKK